MRLYDRSGKGKHCHKTTWGMHCSGVQRDSLGDPLMFVTRRQWRRRASDSDETPPIDLLLLYCVRGPAVFSRFLVCQSHKLEDFVSQASKAPPPKMSNYRACVRVCACVCLVVTYEVCGVGLNRPAKQISVHSGHPAKLGNDGLSWTCARSANETDAWWAVQLAHSLRVTRVKFTNDDENCCDSEMLIVRTTKSRECPYVILFPFRLLAFYKPTPAQSY